MCKCESVKTVSGQQSSASASAEGGRLAAPAMRYDSISSLASLDWLANIIASLTVHLWRLAHGTVIATTPPPALAAAIAATFLRQAENMRWSTTENACRNASWLGTPFAKAQPISRSHPRFRSVNLAMKELAETRCWLRILGASGYIDAKHLEPLIAESLELTRMMGASVSTARSRMG